MFMRYHTLLLFCMIGIFSNAGFSQNIKVLEYDVTSGAFNGLLPFDQPFNLKIKNCSTTVKAVVARILQVNKKDYADIKASKKVVDKDIIPPDIYYHKGNLVFRSDSVIRDVDFSGNEVVIPMPYYLKPDSKYFFDLRLYTFSDLSEEDSTKLTNDIRNDRNFQSIINKAASININDPYAGTLGWSHLVNELTLRAKQIVSSKNPNYYLPDIDFSNQLMTFSQALTSLSNINLVLREELEGFVGNPRLPKLNGFLSNVQRADTQLIQELSHANWVQIRIDDRNYNIFKRHLNNLFTSIISLDTLQKKDLEDKQDYIMQLYDTSIVSIEELANFIVKEIIVRNVQVRSVIISTHPEGMQEQAKLHITFDVGYAYVGQMDIGNPYAAVNIYFRSIDTSLPLSHYKPSVWDCIGSRTSLLIGVSLKSIKKENVREGLLSKDVALVTGIGFRLLPWFKLNGGFYLYYVNSPNPLISREKLSFKGSPFVSLSIDFNLRSFFSTFGNGIITNKFNPAQ